MVFGARGIAKQKAFEWNHLNAAWWSVWLGYFQLKRTRTSIWISPGKIKWINNTYRRQHRVGLNFNKFDRYMMNWQAPYMMSFLDELYMSMHTIIQSRNYTTLFKKGQTMIDFVAAAATCTIKYLKCNQHLYTHTCDPKPY